MYVRRVHILYAYTSCQRSSQLTRVHLVTENDKSLMSKCQTNFSPWRWLNSFKKQSQIFGNIQKSNNFSELYIRNKTLSYFLYCIHIFSCAKCYVYLVYVKCQVFFLLLSLSPKGCSEKRKKEKPEEVISILLCLSIH